jgi:glycosyltransferase involved in cell wall biosynthesis
MTLNNIETEPSIAVDVVIPAYGHEAELRRCLEKVLPQCGEGTRIILVDNAPSPSLQSLCREYPQVTWLHEPTSGSYPARNLGIMHSHAVYVAFTDADCVPTGNWLESGLRYLSAHEDARILGGAIEVFPRHRRPNWVEAFEMAAAFPVKRYIDQQHFAPTANLIVERAVFEEIGLFRQDLLSGGDSEWGKRATGAGIPSTTFLSRLSVTLLGTSLHCAASIKEP